MTAHFNCTPKTPFTLPAVCVRLHKVMAEPQSSPVQCVSHSLSGLCRAAIRKTVFITAARYVRPTAGWQAGRERGGKKADGDFISSVSLTWRSPEPEWSQLQGHSDGPGVLMCPVYLVLMDLFTALNAPPLPSPIPTPPLSLRNMAGGCTAFTFCCPGHLF